MSEQLKEHHEQGGETLDLSSEIERNQQRLEQQAESAETIDDKVLEGLREAIEDQSKSKQEVSVVEKEQDSFVLGTHQQLKNSSYKKTLAQVQTHLKAPDRVFSKLVHNPLIEKASNISAATIARPSGLMGGGICALIGSSLLLYVSKRYGFEYNYLVFAMLFVAGFMVGNLIELAVRLVYRRKG